MRERRSAACSARTSISSCCAAACDVELGHALAQLGQVLLRLGNAAVQVRDLLAQFAQLAFARQDAGLGVVRADGQRAVRLEQFALQRDEAKAAVWAAMARAAARSRTMSVRPSNWPASRSARDVAGDHLLRRGDHAGVGRHALRRDRHAHLAEQRHLDQAIAAPAIRGQWSARRDGP